MQTVTDALVLRERKLDEQDRLLTLLSADRGIITAYAKGAGRMKGSMAGATELLCYSHFVLFQNRERCFADKAEANTLFFGIRGDLEKLTLATYFAQLCCELIPENEPAAEELRLMLNTLYCLERDKLPPLQLKAILELRLLTLTGYMPDLIACRECGGLPEDGVVLFDPMGGSISARGAHPLERWGCCRCRRGSLPPCGTSSTATLRSCSSLSWGRKTCRCWPTRWSNICCARWSGSCRP